MRWGDSYICHGGEQAHMKVCPLWSLWVSRACLHNASCERFHHSLSNCHVSI